MDTRQITVDLAAGCHEHRELANLDKFSLAAAKAPPGEERVTRGGVEFAET